MKRTIHEESVRYKKRKSEESNKERSTLLSEFPTGYCFTPYSLLYLRGYIPVKSKCLSVTVHGKLLGRNSFHLIAIARMILLFFSLFFFYLFSFFFPFPRQFSSYSNQSHYYFSPLFFFFFLIGRFSEPVKPSIADRKISSSKAGLHPYRFCHVRKSRRREKQERKYR